MPKYKNYRNNFSKSNVIYTNADLSRMSFGEASNRRKELVSQYRQIGFPSEKEMQNSSNVVYVNEYTRADGTHVKAHWRSKPEGSGSGTFALEGQPNIIFDDGEPTVVFDESASNNLEEDVGIYFPTTMPTKAPDGPVIYPVETGEGSGTTIGDIIDGVLGWLSLLLEIMTILLGSNTAPVVDDGEMELQVDNSPLGNFAVPVSSSETSSKPLKFENINNEEFIQRFISEMMGLGGSGVGNVLPQIAGDGIIRNEKSPNARFDKANFDKGTSVKQKQGVIFDNAKTTSNPINQPMAQHSDSDIEKYINELMQPSANKSKPEMGDFVVSFIHDFLKGGVQGINSTGTGFGKRYANVIREMMNKEPLTEDEINNIYARIQGTPSNSMASKIGNIVGELPQFLMLPEINVARFPAITNLLLTNMYQSAVTSAKDSIIEHGISNNTIIDTIKETAQSLLNTILLHNLLKGVDSSNILKELEKRLQKLINNLAKDFARPVLQKNGSIVYKKYNGDTATSDEVAARILRNWRKKQAQKLKERELIKKDLKNNLKEYKINGKVYKQIWLPDEEYASVSHEFMTYIMQNNYSEPILQKPMSNGYIYVAVLEEIDGQSLPVFVKKVKEKGLKND